MRAPRLWDINGLRADPRPPERDTRLTLLLTCVTPRFAVQASDRRLTFTDGTVAEEAANKATMLCRHATFAYTGLVHCSVLEPTDELLLRCLAEQSAIDAVLSKLAKESGRGIRNLPLPGVPVGQRRAVRRTSFVGGGFLGLRNPAHFGQFPSPDELHPFLAVISNAQGLTEQWCAEADQEFGVHIRFLKQDEPFLLHAAGQPFTGSLRTAVERDIRRSLDRITRPESLARLLARAIRSVAASNPLVGPNVMCTLVRRDKVRSPATMIRGGMVPLTQEVLAEANYFKWPIDGPQKGESPFWIYSPGVPGSFPYYGPNYTCSGFQMKGMRMEPAVGPPVSQARSTG